ncbi:DUF2510 domain-containing protein [Leucobacter sp. HY1910]
MLEPQQSVADGWYPDPQGGLWLRRWDGTSWTSETRGLGTQSQREIAAEMTGGFGLTAPETGWAGVALALHSALVGGDPVTVMVTLPDGSRFAVNTLDHTYFWPKDPGELAAQLEGFEIAYQTATAGSLPQASNLDGLLWRISQRAFRQRLAPWLQEGDLYRMQRWPNLTTISPELDDMRQAAMLANGMFTIEELAGFSDRQYQPTRALINALSLMNTLKVAAPRDTGAIRPGAAHAAPVASPGQQAAVAAVRKPGLFQRLRNRLGL